MVTHIGDGCRAAGFLPIAMPPSLRHSVDLRSTPIYRLLPQAAMSSFQNSLMLARLTMTSTSRLHTAAAAITTPLVTAPQPFFCQMEILNFVPLASKPAVAAGGSRRYTHPEPRRGRCGSSSFLRVGWSGRGPRSMASSPTRSETLRPHFLMAVGLGPAQKHYRRKDGTRRLPGSQPHHLRRERHHAVIRPGLAAARRVRITGGRRRPSTNRTSFVSPSRFVLPQRTAVGPVGNVRPRLLRILAMKRSPAITAARPPAGRAVSTMPARSCCWWQTHRPPLQG